MDLVRTMAESAVIAAIVIGLGSIKLHWMRSRDERRERKSGAGHSVHRRLS